MIDTDEVAIVPAASGFDVLIFLPDDSAFDARPVVAWAILCTESEGFIRAFPVTVGQAWSINDDRSVRLPSGEVVCDDREWRTDAEWLADMITEENLPRSPQQRASVLALDSFRSKFSEQ